MSFTAAGFQRGHVGLLSPRGIASIGAQLKAFAASAGSSGAWPLANLAIFVPFHVPEVPLTIVEVFWQNGTAAGGNIDIGIYDAAGVRLASLGTTARGSASTVVTSTTWTDYTIAVPGLYYMAMSCDGTNNIFAYQPAAGLAQACGVYEMQSAFVLPSTATFAATTRAYIPAMGLLTNSIALPT